MREGISIEMSAADRGRLERVVADRNSPQKHVWRARIILATAQGCGTAEIMRRAEVSKPCVWRWQERFMREGVAGLLRDQTRKPGLPPLPPAVVDRVVALTLGDPPATTTHWSGRAMAAASGVSLRSVQRIWAAHGLQPHRVKRCNLSTDPAFAAKLRDVVGLYLDPPAHSLVLSVDEKSHVLPFSLELCIAKGPQWDDDRTLVALFKLHGVDLRRRTMPRESPPRPRVAAPRGPSNRSRGRQQAAAPHSCRCRSTPLRMAPAYRRPCARDSFVRSDPVAGLPQNRACDPVHSCTA